MYILYFLWSHWLTAAWYTRATDFAQQPSPVLDWFIPCMGDPEGPREKLPEASVFCSLTVEDGSPDTHLQNRSVNLHPQSLFSHNTEKNCLKTLQIKEKIHLPALCHLIVVMGSLLPPEAGGLKTPAGTRWLMRGAGVVGVFFQPEGATRSSFLKKIWQAT